MSLTVGGPTSSFVSLEKLVLLLVLDLEIILLRQELTELFLCSDLQCLHIETTFSLNETNDFIQTHSRVPVRPWDRLELVGFVLRWKPKKRRESFDIPRRWNIIRGGIDLA